MNFKTHLRDLPELAASIWQDESNQRERVRRLLLAARWQAWKRVVRRPLQVRLFNGIHFRAFRDCGCSSAAFYFRIPNSRHIEFFRSHIAGGTLVDAGANVGMVSMLLADRVQHAILFEPNPTAAARARENIGANGLEFEVHETALSDQTGNVLFQNLGGVNTCNRIVGDAGARAHTVMIPRVTLDAFLLQREALPAPVAAVKIDVEGHENAVLRGMRQTLKTHRPRIVMFEYLERTNLKETFDIFASVDYRVMALSAQGEAVTATMDTPALQDLFAFPSEHLSGATPKSVN